LTEYIFETTVNPESRKTDVVGEAQHYLRCSVPARGDIFRHKTLISCGPRGAAPRGVAPSKTEIANLEFAISINKQVPRLQVAMQHIGRVDIFQTTKSLIDERLKVGISQRLAGTDLFKMR